MNTAEIKAIQNKMESDKQRLQEYLQGSRTAEEKLVSNIIKKIQKAEEKLIKAGIELAERINDDGTFTVILENKDSTNIENEDSTNIENVTVISTEKQSESVLEESNNEEESIEVKKNTSSKKAAPTKKLRDENTQSKPEITKIGVTIKENIKSKIDILADDNGMKSNEVVNDLLERLFDGKNFNIQIEKKEKTKVTSFNIPKQMDKAITRMSKATDIPKSEIFNKLLEASLKEFFE